jgi:signal transduction histidine kinase
MSRRVVAGAVWASSWMLALASVAIAVVWQLPEEPLPGVFLSQAPVGMRARFDDIGVTVALIYGPVAALILARRPHPVGVIVAIHAVGSGIAAFGVQYGLLGAELPGLPLWGLIAFSAGWGFVPGTFMTAALPLLVTRRRVPDWQRAVVIACVVLAAAAFVVSLTQQSAPEPINPLAIPNPAYQSVLPGVYTALSFAAVAISFLSCGVLIARWVRARGRSRIDVAWLTLGHVFLTLSYLALVLPDGLDLPAWIVDFGLVAPIVGQILYPAAIVVVILGQRLWGVELVVSRILLWSLLSVAGVVLYVAVVTIVPVTLRAGGALSLVAPVIVAIAILPVRTWLQRRIDHLIYGEGADTAQLLARLGDRIGELPPGPSALSELAETLRRVLRLGWLEIRTQRHAAAAGRRTAAAATVIPLPLLTDASLSAQPIGGQRLDRRTATVLADVAGLVATVVRLVDAYVVLDAARSALMTRRAGERRAIRRELHDGLGPALAGIGFGLAAAENLAIVDAERARGLLRDLADDVRIRTREVRELANEVSPRRIDAADLPDALQRLVRRFDGPELSARLSITGDVAAVADAADALSLIAAEALTNVARHAQARSVEVSLTISEGRVVLTVDDDGIGIDSGARAGIGLTSMRERVEAVGGELTLETPRVGTRVRACVPAPPSTIRDPSP